LQSVQPELEVKNFALPFRQ